MKLSDYSGVLARHKERGDLIYNTLPPSEGPLFYIKHQRADGTWSGTPDKASSDAVAEKSRYGVGHYTGRGNMVPIETPHGVKLIQAHQYQNTPLQ